MLGMAEAGNVPAIEAFLAFLIGTVFPYIKSLRYAWSAAQYDSSARLSWVLALAQVRLDRHGSINYVRVSRAYIDKDIILPTLDMKECILPLAHCKNDQYWRNGLH